MGEDRFQNLEPNHLAAPNDDGDLVVYCPFEVLVDGGVVLHQDPMTRTATWYSESEPEEIECPVCEVLKGQLHYLGSPDCSDDLGDLG